MGARHVAGDGETETDALFVLVARLVEAVERAEGFLALLGRDPRANVVDEDFDAARRLARRDLHALAIGGGVADEIGQRAA